MFDDDTLACAKIVEKGDPDRFAAVMTLPVDARAKLFPIFAANVEVARAPWVTSEPIIAQMRLQWWADAFAEIQAADMVRRHEVVTPLAVLLAKDHADLMAVMVEARRWDVESEPFEDMSHFDTYLTETTGNLLWVAAQVLGAHVAEVEQFSCAAQGVAIGNWLRAIPALEAAGKRVLVDGRPEAVADLAARGLAFLNAQRGLSRASQMALLTGWRARAALKAAARNPMAVADGALDEGEAWRRLSLVKARVLRRI